MNYQFFIKLTLCTLVITLFYYHIKFYLLLFSAYFASKLSLLKRYPFEVVKGVIELPLIVMFHFIFCILLFYLSHFRFKDMQWFKLPSPRLLLFGILLGIGIMGTASLLGRSYIEIMRYYFPKKFPQDIRNWLAMARGGWIRHHFHILNVFPIPIALSITLGQVCAEEIVFRGIIFNYFYDYGRYLALVVSTGLFMYMQIFHMPTGVSRVFPVLGALVMGLVGGWLYMHVHTLLPLIIAHITFFSVAVL